MIQKFVSELASLEFLIKEYLSGYFLEYFGSYMYKLKSFLDPRKIKGNGVSVYDQDKHKIWPKFGFWVYKYI